MGKKRKQGRREPTKETKSNILLFLAEGEKGRGDIIDMLRSDYNIREPRTIDIHLNQLVANGLIIKHKKNPGLPISYDLPHTFDGFISLFCYLEPGKQPHLLSSPYGQHSINEQFLCRFAREMIKIELLEYRDPFTFCQDEDDPKEDEPLIMDSTDFSFEELFREIQHVERFPITHEIKPIYECQRRRTIDDAQFENEYGPQSRFPSRFQARYVLMFPPLEREELIQILQTSPTALAFLIGAIMKEGRLQRLVLYGYPYSVSVSFEMEIRNNDHTNNGIREGIDSEMLATSIRTADNLTAPTALLQVMRGYLLLDVIEGTVNMTEKAERILWRFLEGDAEIPSEVGR